MEIKVDKTLGYAYVYVPNHPTARHNGCAYYHRYVMYEHTNGQLKSEDHIHHKDGNKLNNDVSNLQIVTAKEHMAIHTRKHIPIEKECIVCKKIFTHDGQRKRSTCSAICRGLKDRRCERPTKEELEILISNYPMTTIAAMYGVSDNAIRKWIVNECLSPNLD